MASPQQLMLLGLPHELLHKVLCECEPADIHSLKITCHALQAYLTNNRQLYKEMYLRRLDTPPRDLDWEHELMQFIPFKSIVDCIDSDRKAANLLFIAERISYYLSVASPRQESSRTIPLLTEISASAQNREAFLCNSSLFQRVRANTSSGPLIGSHRWETPTYNLTEKQRQASAKLHCLYGVPLYTTLQSHTPRPFTRATRTYPYAVSKVYDLRNYTDGTLWGPYLDDGQATVDWEKMEAIIVVLGYNLNEFADKTTGTMRTLCNSIWSKPWKDAAKESCCAITIPRLEEPGLSLDARDPYAVTGTYLRIVCFLDFTELFTYNFVQPVPPQDDIPRPPLDTVEATRLIFMELKVTKIEQPGEDDGQDYPIVHFRGTSRSMDASYDPNAHSNIRGTVRQTKEGEIRWTTYSIYHGEERWKSESIQIGGIRSARGAIGHWFDKDHDIHGPAGPTAFWKVGEDILDGMREEEEEEEDDEDDEDWNDGDDDEEDAEGEEGEGDGEDGDDTDVVMMVDEGGMGGVMHFLLGQGDVSQPTHHLSHGPNVSAVGDIKIPAENPAETRSETPEEAE